jgi:uncharacterized membrane-anchored protein
VSARVRLLAVAVVGLAQLAVPVGMIAGRERTLSEGNAWAFRARPVDPADAFRGRFLALALEPTEAPLPPGLEVERGERVIVPLVRDEEGFARFGPVQTTPPAEGDWMRVPVSWATTEKGGAMLDLPFDRFYLDEVEAPRVDAIWGQGRRERTAWALVRVRGGRAVLADLVIDGRSLRDGKPVPLPRGR